MQRPPRRHHLRLVLDADDLPTLVGVLRYLADDIELEERVPRVITYRGDVVTYRAELTSEA